MFNNKKMYVSKNMAGEIKNHVNIVDIASTYLSLERRGNNYVCNCPFHNEKKPSFYVNADRQRFKCFGCNEGGDVFELVSKLEKCQYPEAVRIVADKAGIRIAGQQRNTNEAQLNRDSEAQKDKSIIKQVNKQAAAYYYYQLRHNDEVKNILKEQHISEETCLKLGIGYAPAGREFMDWMQHRGFNVDDLVKAKLVFKSGHEDEIGIKFQNKIVIPIANIDGEVVSFAGRTLDDKSYENTVDTALYKKGRNLYNIHNAQEAVHEIDAHNIILCDNYNDMFAMKQAGFEQTTALVGTQLTLHQGKMIKEILQPGEELLLAYGNDERSKKNISRAISLLRRQNLLDAGMNSNGIKVSVVDVSPYKTVKDFLLNNSRDDMQERIDNATNHFIYELNMIKDDYNQVKENGKYDEKQESNYYDRIAFKLAAEFSSDIERDAYRDVAIVLHNLDADRLDRLINEKIEQLIKEKKKPPVDKKIQDDYSQKYDQMTKLYTFMNLDADMCQKLMNERNKKYDKDIVAKENIPHSEEKEIGKQNTNTLSQKDNGQDKIIRNELAKEYDKGLIEIQKNVQNYEKWCKAQSKLMLNDLSFRNNMLVYMQNPDASHLCTSEKWKALGRTIKNNAKGINILKADNFINNNELVQFIKNETFNKSKNNADTFNYCLEGTCLNIQISKENADYRFSLSVGDNKILDNISENDFRNFIMQTGIDKAPNKLTPCVVYDVKDTEIDNFAYIDKATARNSEIVYNYNDEMIYDKNNRVKVFNANEKKLNFEEMNINSRMSVINPEKRKILIDALEDTCKEKNIAFRANENLPEDDYIASLLIKMAYSNTDSRSNKYERAVQAETAAYITANNLGLDIKDESFDYTPIINNYGTYNLKEMGAQLESITKNAKTLMEDIKKTLDDKGYTLQLDKQNITSLTQEQKNEFVSQYKGYINATASSISDIRKTFVDNMNEIKGTDNIQIPFLREQIVDADKIVDTLSKMEKNLDKFIKSDDGKEQQETLHVLESNQNKIKALKDNIAELSKEKMQALLDKNLNERDYMRDRYKADPVNTILKMRKEYPEYFKDLSESDISFIAKSKYIQKQFSKLVGEDDKAFIEKATQHLKNYKNVMSDNGIAVEISSLEEFAIKDSELKAGMIGHPKYINSLVADYEQKVRNMKAEGQKRGEYYPYHKCELSIFLKQDDNKEVNVMETVIEIGDSEQNDLTEHLQQALSDTEESAIAQNIYEHYTESINERGRGIALSCDYEQQYDNEADYVYSMEDIQNDFVNDIDYFQIDDRQNEVQQTEDKTMEENGNEERI